MRALKNNACGTRKNRRVAAATLLDFYRPLRFPRLASSAPAAQGSSTVTAKNAITWRFLNAASSPVYEDSITTKGRLEASFCRYGAYGTRTRDPDTASVVRSQLR